MAVIFRDNLQFSSGYKVAALSMTFEIFYQIKKIQTEIQSNRKIVYQYKPSVDVVGGIISRYARTNIRLLTQLFHLWRGQEEAACVCRLFTGRHPTTGPSSQASKYPGYCRQGRTGWILRGTGWVESGCGKFDWVWSGWIVFKMDRFGAELGPVQCVPT